MLRKGRRLGQRLSVAGARLRRRYGWLDHLALAAQRFDQVSGGRLAAAVTYHGFLALFPLLLLAYAILGFLVGGNGAITAEVSDFLRAYLPALDVKGIAEARHTAGLIGMLGVLYAGIGWVHTLRSSIRTVWRMEETPGSLILAWIVDTGVLLALGILMGVSVAVSFALNFGFEWGLEHLGVRSGLLRIALAVLAFVVAIGVDLAVFTALLTVLPRLRMSIRRALVPALIASLGFEALKAFSQFFLIRATSNPAYAVVASAVGVLLFLNLLNELLLFCAALTATSERGEVRERRSFSARWGELRDDAARRAPVDAPTGGVD